MPNRFYVHPGFDFSEGLKGLGVGMQALGQRKERERIEDARQQAVEVFRTGDPDAIAEFAIQNPEVAQQIVGATKFRSEQTKENYVQSLIQAIQDPEKIPEIAEKRQRYLRLQGLLPEEMQETDSIAQRYQEDPAGTLKMLKAELAVADTPKYDALMKATGEFGPDLTDTQKEYMGAKEEGFEGSFLEFKLAGSGKDKTEAIKEYEYGIKNPGFLVKQKKARDDKLTKETAQKTYDDSSSLRKEFLNQSKEYQKVRDAYTRVLGSTKDPSAAGDLSLIFNYMKMLDPGSVVRESEFATAASAGSYGERMQAAANRIISGERLAPEMRNDFVKKSKTLFSGMEKQHKKREKNYTNIARKNNLPVDEVVVDITAEKEETSKYRDGQVAIGPNGEKLVFRNGEWEPLQ